jgi:predicted RNA-binding protein with RPS1 domain
VPGTVVRGKVVSLKDYGAFIELEEGIEGLVHISEMSWTRRVKHPSKMVAVGDMVEAVVLDVDVKQNRISLGMKQLEPNPYEQLTEKYPPGTVVKGHVRNIADFGIFVEIEEGIDGLVHISQLAANRVQKTSDVVKEGDKVKVKLLGFDERGKTRLSMKIIDQTTGQEIPRAEGEPDPEAEFSAQRPPRRDRETVLLYGSLGLLAFWASFGPAAGLYAVLYRVVPLFTFLRAPSRFGMLAALILALFSAFALAGPVVLLLLDRRARRREPGAKPDRLGLRPAGPPSPSATRTGPASPPAG